MNRLSFFGHAAMGTLLFIGFMAFVLLMPYESPSQYKWFILAVLSSAFTGWAFVLPRLGVSAALLFSYCVINGAWFWIWRENRYLALCVSDTSGRCVVNNGMVMPDVYTQQAIKLYAADGIAKLLLVLPPLFYVLKDRVTVVKIGGFLASAFCLLNVVMVWSVFLFSGHWCQPVNSCTGAISNPSMNSSMIVVALPFLIDSTKGWVRYLLLALSVGAVLLSQGSVGVGLLAAMACLYAIRFKWWKILALAPISLLVGWLAFGGGFLSTGDRWVTWVFMMKAWANKPVHYFFGTGYGTFGIFSANLQKASGLHGNNWWVWMHNDWLEIVFTLGLVGGILAAATYLASLKGLVFRKEYTAAISLCLFGLTMGMNFPLHHPLSCALGAWLVVYGLLKDSPEERKTLVFAGTNS